jgi:hypothetical protein
MLQDGVISMEEFRTIVKASEVVTLVDPGTTAYLVIQNPDGERIFDTNGKPVSVEVFESLKQSAGLVLYLPDNGRD